MSKAILYTLDRGKRAIKLRPINGNRVQRKEIPCLEFTIENIERVLLEQFQEVNISENEWCRKQGNPSYDISVEVQGTQTMEHIRAYLDSKFHQRPLGGNRNFEKLDKLNLFLYYQVGSGTFHLKFSNVISPYQQE